jgi:hypothetical protein
MKMARKTMQTARQLEEVKAPVAEQEAKTAPRLPRSLLPRSLLPPSQMSMISG